MDISQFQARTTSSKVKIANSTTAESSYRNTFNLCDTSNLYHTSPPRFSTYSRRQNGKHSQFNAAVKQNSLLKICCTPRQADNNCPDVPTCPLLDGCEYPVGTNRTFQLDCKKIEDQRTIIGIAKADTLRECVEICSSRHNCLAVHQIGLLCKLLGGPRRPDDCALLCANHPNCVSYRKQGDLCQITGGAIQPESCASICAKQEGCVSYHVEGDTCQLVGGGPRKPDNCAELCDKQPGCASYRTENGICKLTAGSSYKPRPVETHAPKSCATLCAEKPSCVSYHIEHGKCQLIEGSPEKPGPV
ncbi:hypothetical protein PtrM4_071990 [Pyrenophora tritici-repentis]|uniref:Apple domain-containing protein n=1 Tax=Pyrenophora tritici-repentis TaxID=45151 RepID=A0A834VTL5_9PLEO|nr:hypothetical protein PtrM4_071990 [Pyrenophora tritici-repentis]